MNDDDDGGGGGGGCFSFFFSLTHRKTGSIQSSTYTEKKHRLLKSSCLCVSCSLHVAISHPSTSTHFSNIYICLYICLCAYRRCTMLLPLFDVARCNTNQQYKAKNLLNRKSIAMPPLNGSNSSNGRHRCRCLSSTNVRVHGTMAQTVI